MTDDEAVRALIIAIRDDIRENGHTTKQAPEVRAKFRERVIARSGVDAETAARVALQVLNSPEMAVLYRRAMTEEMN